MVKRTIRDGIFDDGLTQTGFLFLHTLFIQRGRHETTWTVLRKFGYNDRVQLDEAYLNPPLDIPAGCSAELTSAGYRFLTSIFEKFDSDGDGALCPSELDSLFSVCSEMPAFFEPKFLINSVHTNELGWPSLRGFLSAWTLITHTEPKSTLKYLAHLGYGVGHSDQTPIPAVHGQSFSRCIRLSVTHTLRY